MRCTDAIHPVGSAGKGGTREALGYVAKDFQEEAMTKLRSEVDGGIQ